MRQIIHPITYPLFKISNRPTFSLPIFILIISILLVSLGFWNMYNQELKKQSILAIEPNMFSSIKDLTTQTNNVLNQSVTIGNINVVDKIENQSFLISDGDNILLVIVPKNVNTEYVNEKISNTPDFLTMRGVIRTFDQETIQQYHLSADNYPLLKKQKIYLEITEPPELNYKLFESDILDNTDSI